MKKQIKELIEVRNALQGLWVAAVFALILRAYLVEAFVIPTGSMAPRLMGQHVVMVCPDCGTSFPRDFGFNDMGNNTKDPHCKCPNCGLDLTITKGQRVKNGDRVMVIKMPKPLQKFDRWNVIVFRDPPTNSNNYIKRLVGLPGEALKIVHGDLYRYPIEDVNGDNAIDENDLPVAANELKDWQIIRKSYKEQQILWQPLFDSEYPPANLPQRTVSAMPAWREIDGALGSWDLTVNSSRGWHFKSDAASVIKFADGDPRVFKAINSYNTNQYNSAVQGYCNDLKLETIIEPQQSSGQLRMVLSHYDNYFAAEIDLASSTVKLVRAARQRSLEDVDWSDGELLSTYSYNFKASQDRPLRIAFWQADFAVGVAIDDKPVIATTPEQYTADCNKLIEWLARNSEPRPDVLIEGLKGDFTLWHTKVMRDVYYTTPAGLKMSNGAEWEYTRKNYPELRHGRSPIWAHYNNPIVLRKYLDDRSQYDEFFMCGDNSPSSYDSRLWTSAAPSMKLYNEAGDPQYRLGTVPRYNIVGKAFMVYWPAGYPIAGKNKVPLGPNVGKIRLIR